MNLKFRPPWPWEIIPVPIEQEARLAPTAGLEAAGKRKITALAGNRIVMHR